MNTQHFNKYITDVSFSFNSDLTQLFTQCYSIRYTVWIWYQVSRTLNSNINLNITLRYYYYMCINFRLFFLQIQSFGFLNCPCRFPYHNFTWSKCIGLTFSVYVWVAIFSRCGVWDSVFQWTLDVQQFLVSLVDCADFVWLSVLQFSPCRIVEQPLEEQWLLSSILQDFQSWLDHSWIVAEAF